MNAFSKNVLKLSVGNITAQAISIIAMPVITRLYSPEDYGLFSIYLSITMILFPISNLHYHNAMILPEKDSEAVNMLGISVISVFVFSLFLAGFIPLLSYMPVVPQKWISADFAGYLWLIPAGVLVQGNQVVFLHWALRYKMFGKMAAARVNASVNDRALTLAAGFWTEAGPLGLIGGRIFGPFVSLCYLLRQTFLPSIQTLRNSLSLPEMRRLAAHYKKFCTYSILSELMLNCSREAPLILLACFFSPVTAGHFALAMRVVNMPMKLIGEAICKVFLQRATADHVKGVSLLEDTIRLFGYLIYMSVPVVLVFLCAGKDIFVFIFGPEWEMAGIFTQILILSFLGMFLYNPLSALFVAFERLKQNLMVNLCLFAVRAGAIIIAGYFFKRSIQETLLWLAGGTCLVYIGSYVYLFSLVGLNIAGIAKIISSKTVMMAPIICGALLARPLLENHDMLAGAILLVALILQGAFIVFSEPRLKRFCRL